MPSQITGNNEVAIHLYQALEGKAPSNALLNSYTAQMAATSQAAWANEFASGYTEPTTAYVTRIMKNLSLTAENITQSAYDALYSSAVSYFNSFGLASRGVITAQLAGIISNLENATGELAVYSKAAVALNNQALGNFNYSAQASSTTSQVVAPANPATYVLTGAASVDEGSTATFNLVTQNVADGTVVKYAVTGVSAADVTGALTGSVVVQGGKATITVPTVADLTTEGAEALKVTIGDSLAMATTTVNDTSTTPVYTVTAGAASVNEGGSATFTVKADTKINGTVAYAAKGVTEAAAGTVTLVDGVGTITIPLAADAKTEGAETLTVTVGSASASSTVADTSVTPVLANDSATGTSVSGQGTAIIKQSALLANDTGSDSKALAGAVTVATVKDGQAFASSNGDIVFVANAGVREGSFTYNVAGVDSKIAGTVNVLINSAPVLTTTALTTSQDTAATGTVTATDADSDTVTLTYTAKNGTVVAGDKGAYTYTPNAGFFGTDTITVTGTDTYKGAGTGTIAVTVNAVPVFSISSAAAVAEGANLAVTVSLANKAAATAYSVVVTPTFGGTASAADVSAVTLDAASTAAGITYNSTTGVLSVPAGAAAAATNMVLTWPVVADAVSPEAGESVTFTMSAPTGAGAKLAAATATTTTLTDVPVTYTLVPSVTSVYEGQEVTFTLQAFNGTTKVNLPADTNVAFKVVAGNTTAADQGTGTTNLNDFSQGSFNPSTKTIAAGTGSTTYAVTSNTDSIVELTETYKVVATIGGVEVASVETTLLDGATANGGQTFTLTTGVDTVGSGGMKGSAGTTATAGDDTITGQISGASTWTALDAIDGGAGTDTFNIQAINAFALPAGATLTNVEKVTISGASTVGTVGAAIDVKTAFAGVTNLTVAGGTELGLIVPTTAAVTVSGITGAGNGVLVTNGVSQTVTLTAQDGPVTLSKSTGAVNFTTTNTNKNVTIDDGTTVSVTSNDSTGGTIKIGNTTAPSGAVSVTSTNAPVKATDATLSAVTVVKGGSTVSVTQTATGGTVAATDTTGATITQGVVTITGSTATTSVTSTQTVSTTKVAAVDAVAGVTETASVKFDVLKAGDALTLSVDLDGTADAGELTITAAADMTAAQVAQAFAALINGDTQGNQAAKNGVYTGAASLWTSATTTGDTVVLTSTTANSNVTDLEFVLTNTSGNSKAATVTTTAGSAATASKTGVFGVIAGQVVIDDNATAASLKTVTVNSYGNASTIGATNNVSKLETLTLANSGGATAGATNGSMTVNVGGTLSSLNVGLNNIQGAVTLTGAGLKTVNLTLTGANSSTALSAAAAETLTIAGDKSATLSAGTFTALKTLTVTGTAGATFDSDEADTLTSVSTTGTTGSVTAFIDGTLATYSGGAGVDTVTLVTGTALTKAIDLGAGDDTLSFAAVAVTGSTATLSGGAGTDTLSMNAARAAALDDTAQTFYTNFERLVINDAVGSNNDTADTVTIDLANLGFTNYVTTNGTLLDTTTAAKSDTLVLDKLTSGGTVVIAAAPAGANTKQTIQVKDASTGTADVVNVINSATTSGLVTIADVETVNFSSTVAATNTLTAAAATTLNITGSGSANLTLTGSTKLTLIDGSKASGAITVISVNTTDGVTIKGGSGADSLTSAATSTAADVLDGGAGNDTLTANKGLSTLTGGAGNDTFVIISSLNSSSYATITDFTSSDVIKIAGMSSFSSTKITQADTAVFQDYANAAMNSLGAGAATWFQFAGNTYIVMDEATTNSTTFINGEDIIVKLTGLIDLTNASFNNTSDTLALTV